MEENNQNETNEVNEEKKHICFKDHCWKMCLGMVIAAFLGGFLATYFVADQMAERCHKHYFTQENNLDQSLFNEYEKDIRSEMKQFNKMMKKRAREIDDFNNNPFFNEPLFMPAPVKIESEIDDGIYKIEVGLKPFQGDESKINYNISGRKLTVFGKSKIKNGKREEDISFSHDFIMPENADTMNIKKEKIGDKLIISVPMKQHPEV